eukprot:TRINITY_DN15799_c0_g3_i2.p1 TRINITY_DN15799_c0_g3~~TRINITY_DN15799_c0_g3_i2.p1  ORF type:complete len:138 (-),score=8.44 TRINITY_DN15799_c0_g3_i2:197-610(-)
MNLPRKSKTMRIYPEDPPQISRSSTIASSSIPTLKGDVKPVQKKLFNMGIIRSNTINFQGANPGLECAHLVPIEDANSAMRRDRNGKQIDKRMKRHHITFRDEVIGGDVADVEEVISYKRFNCSYEEEIEKCVCTIF